VFYRYSPPPRIWYNNNIYHIGRLFTFGSLKYYDTRFFDSSVEFFLFRTMLFCWRRPMPTKYKLQRPRPRPRRRSYLIFSSVATAFVGDEYWTGPLAVDYGFTIVHTINLWNVLDACPGYTKPLWNALRRQ